MGSGILGKQIVETTDGCPVCAPRRAHQSHAARECHTASLSLGVVALVAAAAWLRERRRTADRDGHLRTWQRSMPRGRPHSTVCNAKTHTEARPESLGQTWVKRVRLEALSCTFLTSHPGKEKARRSGLNP